MTPAPRAPRTVSHLPVLNYHGIESRTGEYSWLDIEKPYVLRTATFKKQMGAIVQSGLQSLKLDDIPRWKSGKFDHAIVITFDDGHQSHWDRVVDILKQHGLHGIFFVSAGLIGQKGQMGWSELHDLLQMGFEIGSHGWSHVPLKGLGNEALDCEIRMSKENLEDCLGSEIKAFSIPKGFYQPEFQSIAKKAGYRYLFTSQFDYNCRSEDCMRLKRLTVKRALPLESFIQIIHGQLGMKKYWERLKETSRSVMPPRTYDALADLKRTFFKRPTQEARN